MPPAQALQQISSDATLPLPNPSYGHTERRPGWERQLQRTLKEWRSRGFSWGRSDCVHFVCACIESMTGKDYLADIETYSCEREALEVLASLNHRGLQNAVEISLGPSEDLTPELMPLRTGDVVLTMRPVVGRPHRRGPGLGICVGPKALFVGAAGLEEVLVADCLCGWRV